MARIIITFLLPIVCGAGGFFLRRYQLLTGFDASGLALPWNPASIMLLVLSVLVIIACIVLCAVCRYKKGQSYIDTFSVPGNVCYLIFSILPAILLAIGAVMGLAELFVPLLDGEKFMGADVIPLIQWIVCILAVIALVSLAIGNFRYSGRHRDYGGSQQQPRQNSLALLALPFTACLWLVTTYQEYSTDPVILDYVYKLFAVVCTLLAVYFICAFSYQKSHPRLCLFFNLLGLFFSFTALADSLSWATRFLMMGCILYMAYSALLLLIKSTSSQRRTVPEEDEDLSQADEQPESLSVDSILDDMIPDAEPQDTEESN